jgi:hypothetical protein
MDKNAKNRRTITLLTVGLAAAVVPAAVLAPSAAAAAAAPAAHSAVSHTVGAPNDAAAFTIRPAGTVDGGYSLISSNSGGANLRASSTMGSTSYEYLPNGTEVLMICWVTGQTVSPPNSNYTSNRWFKVEPAYDFTVGYVHSSLVIDQATVPAC